jgi:hypothetical protein
LRCLRKVLHLDTTYMNRANTNVFVFRRAQEALTPCPTQTDPHPRPPVLLKLSELYLRRKHKFFAKILLAAPDDPTHFITFSPGTLRPRDHNPKRPGRPKQKWVDSCLEHFWQQLHIRHLSLPAPRLCPDSPLHQNLLNFFAANPQSPLYPLLEAY